VQLRRPLFTDVGGADFIANIGRFAPVAWRAGKV
jgi:hypothetical protein